MMTSTAHIIRNIVIIVMANFRSVGLCDGFLSMNGTIASSTSAIPGSNTPAIIGLNIFRSSCRPRKYHGAFDGFGVAFTSARPSSGAFTIAENTVTNAISDRIDANSSTSRCGHTCTLSWASARVCWIEPDLTTVRSRWVWPPGPVPVGAGAATAVAVRVAPPPPARRGLAASAARERGLALARTLEQVRGDSALVSR